MAGLKQIVISTWIVCSGLAYSQALDTKPGSGASQGYEGPSILSRDQTLIGERGGKLLDFRLYGSLTGVYDSGLTSVSTDQNGKLLDTGGNYGTEVGFGAFGTKTWRKDSVNLEYHGAYRHYTTNSFFDGTDQFLNLRYGRILSRRFTLDIKETAGITSLSNGSFSYLPLTTSDLVAVPANELFDNRTLYTQTRATLLWQKTARLSFSGGGDEYLVRRRAAALAGLTGYGAHGDMAYRVTRRQTLNVAFNFTHYEEQHAFGFANIQTYTAGYNLGLGRTYDFGISLGASYLDYRGLETIQLDPAVVAIIGQASVVRNFQRNSVLPYGELRLQRKFNRSSISVDASTGVTPGNGVFLTSRQRAAGLQYSIIGPKRWSVGARLNYNQLSALGQSIGDYSGYQGGIGGTYRLNGLMHMEFRYDYRHYTTQNNIFSKDSHRISLGLAFSTGDRPLQIW